MAKIVADADRLSAGVRDAQAACAAASPERGQIGAAAQRLGQLLHQDVARSAAGVRLKQGVNRDRIVSVPDPKMRHGRKSSRQRFDGHKAAVAVDPRLGGPRQLITAVAVLPGNAPDAQGALELVAQSERHTGGSGTATIADAAYWDGHTRQQSADAGRALIAHVPKRPGRPPAPRRIFRSTWWRALAPARWARCRALGAAGASMPRPASQSAPAGTPVAGLTHAPAQCGFRTLSPSPPDCGASPGGDGAIGSAAGPGTWGVKRPPPSSISPPPSPT